METKICSKCKEEKNISDFGIRKDRKSGFQSWCYKCKGDYKNKKYYKNKLEDPISLWINRSFIDAKHRSKRDNISFSITKQNIKDSLYKNDIKCTYCDREFNFQGTPKNKDSSPTIDRIINAKGYDYDNITISCYRCNSIKRDATFDEIIKIGEKLMKLIKEKEELLKNN